jgi:hypothetical protein
MEPLVKLIKKFTFSAIQAAALMFSLSCSCIGPRHPEARTKPYLPDCVIIQSEPYKRDLNFEAYRNALDTVALKLRTEPPGGLEKLAALSNHLLLIIPMTAAESLTQSQIDSVLSMVGNGAILISEGITPLSKKLGFLPNKSIQVQQFEEIACPEIEISWEKAEKVSLLKAPAGAIVLNREKTSREAMACLLPHGRGKCLLLAAELDPLTGEAYARFPYLLQELQQAGLNFPFRSARLSTFFDYGYRYSEDPDVLAKAWRKTGIQAIHVGTWDFYDCDPTAETYLHKLINACHQNGILVYGWLELPHVSTRFWEKKPEWREKTATGRDAHVDWRYVMNLNNPQCFQAISEGLERLFRRFDWDGANLSELYFDSPAGKAEPGSFTPLNRIVRSEFKRRSGIDPLNFFMKGSPYYWKRNVSEWKKFVDYRVELERDLNERFLQLLSGFRNSFAPDLDIVVTYIDNIYDPSMREAVGADVNGMLKLLERYKFTLVMEDPGSVWHLGPRRYEELAQTYSRLTPNAGQLGIDINIIDRDQRAYPTQKQTGTEFLELFYHAGHHFQTVMAYSEQTILPQDARLVSFAITPEIRAQIVGSEIRMHAPIGVNYCSGFEQADFYVDGSLWPCVDGGEVLLPSGSHSISIGSNAGMKRPRLIKLNGNLSGARYASDRAIEFSYNAHCRAISVFDHALKSLQIDDREFSRMGSCWAILPRGAHKVRAAF